jgi:nicotinate-nucleotide pyrophosphorylase (carboxylating)
VIARPLLERIVALALEEDLAGGDLTTEATVDAATQATARALARTELVVCGFPVFETTFRQVDPELKVTATLAEGATAKSDDVLWEVSGSARSILMAERTALNFVQRLSGSATLAHQYVSALPAGSKCRIADTRKTTPGLRTFERYAVRCGGAWNHRDTLGSAVLIKDNHIKAAGGIALAVAAAKQRAPHTCKVEIEVESLEELEQALTAGADIVMLDNFEPGDISQAVAQSAGRALLEVSGRVPLDRIHDIAATGVDVISIGALTHSAPAADISLEIISRS